MNRELLFPQPQEGEATTNKRHCDQEGKAVRSGASKCCKDPSGTIDSISEDATDADAAASGGGVVHARVAQKLVKRKIKEFLQVFYGDRFLFCDATFSRCDHFQ